MTGGGKCELPCCAAHLRGIGPTKATGVPGAWAIMHADHNCWFERPADSSRGIYGLTPKGLAVLEHYVETVAALEHSGG